MLDAQATLDPSRLAEEGRRLACPVCGESVYREPLAGRPGVRVLRASCTGLDCRWRQDVEVPLDGSGGGDARTVEPPDPTRRTSVLSLDGPACGPGPGERNPAANRRDAGSPFARLGRDKTVYGRWRNCGSPETSTSGSPPAGPPPPRGATSTPPPPQTRTPHPEEPPMPRETPSASALTRSDKIRIAGCRKITPDLTADDWIAAGRPRPIEWKRRHQPAPRLVKATPKRAPKPAPGETAQAAAPRSREATGAAPNAEPAATEPCELMRDPRVRLRVLSVDIDGEADAGTIANLLGQLAPLLTR